MKKTNLLTASLICVVSVVLSILSLSSARAGGGGDDIVIFRSTQSERSISYYQTSVSTPDARVRGSNRATSYVILNLATGEYREVNYWTSIETDMEGKRTRVKYYLPSRFDRTASAMFQTGPADRRNYLILSLFGSGSGDNFSFFQNGIVVSTDVDTQTLVGLMRIQRIRTVLGIVECIAPSAIRGELGFEEYRSASDGAQSRVVRKGIKTLRIDKRRMTHAKDTGAASLQTFQNTVGDYLESRGYIPVPNA